LRGNPGAQPGYVAAGFFVTHLAQRYGWQRVGELYRRVPPGVTAADFERQFARVFPTSVDQAWTEALDTPDAAACQKDWQCMGTPLAVGETAALDCDGEMHRTIDSEGGGHAIALRLEGRLSGLRLGDCAATAAPSYLVEGFVREQMTHWLNLPRGSYAMFHGEARFPRQVQFLSSLPEGLVGDRCESAGVVSLDPDGETALDFLPGVVGEVGADAETTAWIRLAGGGRNYQVMIVDLFWNDRLETDAVTLCNDCGGSAACVPIPPFGELTSVAVGNDAVLRLRGVYAAPPPSRSFGQVVFYTSTENAAP
jgi:hypothetical protein